MAIPDIVGYIRITQGYKSEGKLNKDLNQAMLFLFTAKV